MDLPKLKALIDLLSQSSITEIELVDGDETIRLVRAATHPAPPLPTLQDGQDSPGEPAGSPAGQAHLVTAPMCGILHLTPSQDGAPFVVQGEQVETGQKLCLIEAMKVFTAVVAERAGRITAVLAEGGQEVAAGQPLFEIT